jgi:lysozyme
MNKQTKKVLIIGAIVLLLIITTSTVSLGAENIIKYFEAGGNINQYLTAYQDPAGIWTIGYGSIFNYDQNRPVQPGDQITEQTAINWMRKEMAGIIPQIKALVKVPINQNQLDSLTSFVYNLGIGSLADSTLLSLLNQGADKQTVAAQFLRWNKAHVNGQLIVLPGLTARRQAEADLFVK